MKKFAAFLILLSLTGCASHDAETDRIISSLKDVGSVVSLIRREYVEPVELKTLIHGALRGMMKTLDPYSQYLDEKQYAELKADTGGEFTGIGVDISVKHGVLRVVSPLDDSPAEAAGIKAGDVILKIDDESTREMMLGDAVEKLRGVPGTKVKVTFMHEGSTQISEMTITREAIKIESVKEVKMLEAGIGYIRIATFHENTPLEFAAAVKILEKDGARALIVDVRNNAGGLLTAGEHVAEAFVPKGQVIVSTKSRSGKQDKTYVSENASPAVFHPLVLLVNKGSASSSEIFAGAVQDYGLGTIVGAQTFGKGSVQALVPLPDGSALRLTTSKYYTPKGRLIHETGITPDAVVNSEGALEKAIEICKNTK